MDTGGIKMDTHVTPLHDHVLVRRLEEPEMAKGGTIIPDSAKEKPQEGEVIAVGSGKRSEKARAFPSRSSLAIGSFSANRSATTSRSTNRII
jgi:co-chaperonin GroES (HSP10)